MIFRIGPTRKENDKVMMQPVLWEFRNGTDWKFNDGTYSHPLGPGVKKVMLMNKMKPDSETIERVIPFILETAGLPTNSS